MSSLQSGQSSKRKCLSFEAKLKIIEDVEKGDKSKAQICRENNIVSSTLSTFLKDKDKIRAAVEQGSTKHKRHRVSTYEDVDKALLLWLKQARSKDVPISGPVLVEKGEELARHLGHVDFRMSGGWLDRFKMRHGIVMKTVCGEAAAAKGIDTAGWETKLQAILQEYEPRNIINADETGLFYKCLPNKSLAFQGEICTGQKIPKERISLLCAATMSGEKLPLLAIGKHEKPRCFKNVRTLPVTYRFNKKAWMTSQLFEEWIRKLDRQFVLQGRSVAVIIDNCSAHPKLTNLRAIQMFYLPPNTTSRLQPCDQGIIKTFKTYYRKRVLRRFIQSYDGTGSTSSHFKMSLLDALTMAAASWNDVSDQTVIKCFQHAGFMKQNTPESTSTTTTTTDKANVPANIAPEIEEISNLFDKFAAYAGNTNVELTAEDFVINIDESAATSEELSASDIAELLQTLPAEEEEIDEKDTALPTVSSNAAMQALEQIRLYFMQQNDGSIGD